MKAREVVLAILIILAGIFITEVKSGRLEWRWDVGDFQFARAEEFLFEETQDIAAPLPAEIEIQNAHGTVAVEGAETGAIVIRFKKRVFRKEAEDAQKTAEAIKMIVNRAGTRLVLSTNREDFRRRHFETDFKLTVPLGTPVIVRNSHGLVQVGGTGRTDISNPHGEVVAADIRGGLVLETRHEDVTIDGVRGDARFTCPSADVVAKNIDGELIVDHSYGRLRLENVVGKLTVNGRNSEVFARGLGAAAEIRSSYEPVSVIRARDVTIRGRNNEISVAEVTGRCEVSTEYGTVRVDGLIGDLMVEGRKTGVVGRNLKGESLKVLTSHENVELLGFSGGATVNLSHASLVLEPEDVTGPLSVRGDYADIRLVWPSGGRNPFEAETRQGTIFWGLAIPPSSSTTNGTSITKAFLDETGRPPVVLRTTYGDIRVEESSRRPS